MDEDFNQNIEKTIRKNSPKSVPLVMALLSSYTKVKSRQEVNSNIEIKAVGEKSTIQGPVSEADYSAQIEDMLVIHKYWPNAKFVLEENKIPDSFNEFVLKDENYIEQIRTLEKIVFIDPIDGSTCHILGKVGWWSMTAALMENGKMTTGAIYNPDARKLVYGDENGAFTMELDENGRIKNHRIENVEQKYGNIILAYIGADTTRLPRFQKIPYLIKATSVLTAPSCALAFMDIILGKAKLMVQPVQSPWDYAAGIAIIKSNPNLDVKYYTEDLDRKKIYFHETPLPKFFSSKERVAGFIVGEKSLVKDMETVFEQNLIW